MLELLLISNYIALCMALIWFLEVISNHTNFTYISSYVKESQKYLYMVYFIECIGWNIQYNAIKAKACYTESSIKYITQLSFWIKGYIVHCPQEMWNWKRNMLLLFSESSEMSDHNVSIYCITLRFLTYHNCMVLQKNYLWNLAFIHTLSLWVFSAGKVFSCHLLNQLPKGTTHSQS